MDDLTSLAIEVEPNGSLWLPVNGTTLRPLLRQGEEARFERCDAGSLRVGDIVLVRRASVWMVRLVVGLTPLTTALIRGADSLETGSVHARLTARRRNGRVRRFDGSDRTRALLTRRLLGVLTRPRAPSSRLLRRMRALRQTLRGLPVVRFIRRRQVGAVQVRQLTPDDAAALERFAEVWLPHLNELMMTQLPVRWQRTGLACGAFTASGELVGFVFLDEYTQEGVDLEGMWVRALKVIPTAQRLGIGARLIQALCEEAAARGISRIHADINESNLASLRLFRDLGFIDSRGDILEQLNSEFFDPDSPRRIVAVEKDVS